MGDGVRRSSAELHRLVIGLSWIVLDCLGESPFNVQLDGTDPTYPAGRDPVWNPSFTVSCRDDIVAPAPTAL